MRIGEITIKKATFNPDWFQTVTSIDYGKDEEDYLKPGIKDAYSVGGHTVTGYGEIRFELYRDAELTQKVSRNAEGHYEVNADPDQEYATYYMGITSSGGKNVEAQENPVRIGTDLKIYRASNTIYHSNMPGYPLRRNTEAGAHGSGRPQEKLNTPTVVPKTVNIRNGMQRINLDSGM